MKIIFGCLLLFVLIHLGTTLRISKSRILQPGINESMPANITNVTILTNVTNINVTNVTEVRTNVTNVTNVIVTNATLTNLTEANLTSTNLTETNVTIVSTNLTEANATVQPSNVTESNITVLPSNINETNIPETRTNMSEATNLTAMNATALPTETNATVLPTETNATVPPTNVTETNATVSSTNATETNATVSSTNATETNTTVSSTNATETNTTVSSTNATETSLVSVSSPPLGSNQTTNATNMTATNITESPSPNRAISTIGSCANAFCVKFKHCLHHQILPDYTHYGCSICEKDYMLSMNPAGAGTCKKPNPIPHCLGAQGSDGEVTTCWECEKNYVLTNDFTNCTAIPTNQTKIENCLDYFMVNDSMKCNACAKGYTLSQDKNKCDKGCSIDNCEQCSFINGRPVCWWCKENYIGIIDGLFFTKCLSCSDWGKALMIPDQ